jgi:hypothetical protein
LVRILNHSTGVDSAVQCGRPFSAHSIRCPDPLPLPSSRSNHTHTQANSIFCSVLPAESQLSRLTNLRMQCVQGVTMPMHLNQTHQSKTTNQPAATDDSGYCPPAVYWGMIRYLSLAFMSTPRILRTRCGVPIKNNQPTNHTPSLPAYSTCLFSTCWIIVGLCLLG